MSYTDIINQAVKVYDSAVVSNANLQSQQAAQLKAVADMLALLA